MGKEKSTVRCAIYTRKSHEEGLEQDFNSLDAQREAGENYIASQKARGWICLPERYDDPGFSGGNINRPALTKLLSDIKSKKIDVVVVYKIDRLSRSICDFAELSRIFDQYGTSFVAVTQDINTSTSSGRMMLNILVTFAQYEREVIADRIRDKMSASRRKGLWVGGVTPYGYQAVNKRLEIVPEQAEIVKEIFQRYSETGSAKQVCNELNAEGIRNRKGKNFTPALIYRMLDNHSYIGQVQYKGEVFPGEHAPIINEKLWNAVHEALHTNTSDGGGKKRQETTACLRGLLKCGHCGCSMGPTYTGKKDKRYIYYICEKDYKRPQPICPVRRIASGDIETLVIGQLQKLFSSSTFIDLTAECGGLSRDSVANAFANLDGFWNELFPVEQNRLLRLLLDHVTINEDNIEITVKTRGMKALMKELEYEHA